MKTGWWLGWVVWLALGGTVVGMETMAYRFVGEPACVQDMRWQDELEEVKQPPKSCFIGGEDELADLGGWCRERGIPLDGGWVIWNRSRRMLVVRAAMFDQWRVITASGFDSQPKLLRVSLEWFRGVEALAVPPPVREADASLVIVGRSGQKAVGELQGGGKGDWKLLAEVEPIAEPLYEVIDLRYNLEANFDAAKPGWRWTRTSAVTLVDGRERVEEAGKTPDGKSLRMGMRVEAVAAGSAG